MSRIMSQLLCSALRRSINMHSPLDSMLDPCALVGFGVDHPLHSLGALVYCTQTAIVSEVTVHFSQARASAVNVRRLSSTLTLSGRFLEALFRSLVAHAGVIRRHRLSLRIPHFPHGDSHIRSVP